MDTINLGFLILHIISGYISLTSGSISMISRKGGKAHKLSGGLFFNAMIGVTISAIYLSIVKDNSFLLHVGIFVFYRTRVRVISERTGYLYFNLSSHQCLDGMA